MATYINPQNPKKIVVVPANSEATVEMQRFGCKDRTVCGYYTNSYSQQFLELFNNFTCKCFVDMALSYEFCKDLFSSLIEKCGMYYKSGLEPLKKTMAFIKMYLDSKIEDALFFDCYISLTDSKKYLKMASSNSLFERFKQMILGDIIEIVFKKIDDSTVIVYLRPKIGIEWTVNSTVFNDWIQNNVGKK